MGHMHPKELSKLLIRRVFAKGKATIAECIEQAQREKLTVSCGEGQLEDQYMYEMAFEFLICHHLLEKQLEPVYPDKRSERLWGRWLNDDSFSSPIHTADGLWEDASDKARERLQKIVYSVPVRFAKGARARYLKRRIIHLEHVES